MAARRLFHNMRLAHDHAKALAAFDTRAPEYVNLVVDRQVLRAAVEFLRKMSGGGFRDSSLTQTEPK